MEYRRRFRGLAVEHAVLGFLVDVPAHGYELRDRLARGLGAFWRIASSQLYQVLHRLEEEGWVKRTLETGSAGPPRIVFQITRRGQDAFWGWAVSPVPHVRQIRVEFLAKAYFLRRLEPDRLAELVTGQIEALSDLARSLGAKPCVETDDVGLGELAASYRKSQVEGTIGWLKENEQKLIAGREE